VDLRDSAPVRAIEIGGIVLTFHFVLLAGSGSPCPILTASWDVFTAVRF
jgi:hypothetical protein